MQAHVHGPGCGCKEYISGEEGMNTNPSITYILSRRGSSWRH